MCLLSNNNLLIAINTEINVRSDNCLKILYLAIEYHLVNNVALLLIFICIDLLLMIKKIIWMWNTFLYLINCKVSKDLGLLGGWRRINRVNEMDQNFQSEYTLLRMNWNGRQTHLFKPIWQKIPQFCILDTITAVPLNRSQ